MNFEFVPEFQKEVKRLAKKWRSLPDDIEYVKPRIENLYAQREDIDTLQYRTDFFAGKTATRLFINEKVEVVKMRLDVTTLGSNSKVRLIFIVIVSDNLVKFVELYAKNSNEKEDSKRIQKYLGIY